MNKMKQKIKENQLTYYVEWRYWRQNEYKKEPVRVFFFKKKKKSVSKGFYLFIYF